MVRHVAERIAQRLVLASSLPLLDAGCSLEMPGLPV